MQQLHQTIWWGRVVLNPIEMQNESIWSWLKMMTQEELIAWEVS